MKELNRERVVDRQRSGAEGSWPSGQGREGKREFQETWSICNINRWTIDKYLGTYIFIFQKMKKEEAWLVSRKNICNK